ncbi:uncharacterized protein LOC118418253 [Branchiostoma floridae]|uniref:Uncharacterized protein LOC118418253 n=1 Tax=Branchiostoma floridae TaxID=7739 RepID=A0A9J7LC48_BRAFL|nr:uncharacterized protein LOC118418253 [Branchiostoma floridae]
MTSASLLEYSTSPAVTTSTPPAAAVTTTSCRCHHHQLPLSPPPAAAVTTTSCRCHHHHTASCRCHNHQLPVATTPPTINAHGLPGKNIPKDFAMEILNKKAEDGLTRLGPNMTGATVTREGNSLGVLSEPSAHLSDISLYTAKGKHTVPDLRHETEQLVEELKMEDPFDIIPGLKTHYESDTSYRVGASRGKNASKVPVEEIRDVLRSKFGYISQQNAGSIVTKAFPGCKKERSYNHGKCYYGIRKITTGESSASPNGTLSPTTSQAQGCQQARLHELMAENETLRTKIQDYKATQVMLRNKIKIEQSQKQIIMNARPPVRRTGTIPASYCVDRTLLTPVRHPLLGNDIILGEGTFGECKLYSYRGSNVAVKQFKDVGPEREIKQDLVHEAKVLMNMFTHKSLPALVGVAMDRPPFLLITSFHGCNETSVTLLEALYKGLSFVNLMQWKDLFCQVAAGLNHIHKCGFLHCDLKLNNVCVEKTDASYTAIIIDFGKSCEMHKSYGYHHLSRQEREQRAVDYPHIDPSLYRDRLSVHSVLTDIYSFGKMIEKVVRKLKTADGELDAVYKECTHVDKCQRLSLMQAVSALAPGP